MMTCSAYGRLGKEPKSISTTTGTPMAAASIAVDVSNKNDPDATHWLRILAFGQAAESLLKHQSGECLAVTGRLQRNAWTDKDGARHEDLQLIADNVTSSRTVRPGARRAPEAPRKSRPLPEGPLDSYRALAGA